MVYRAQVFRFPSHPSQEPDFVCLNLTIIAGIRNLAQIPLDRSCFQPLNSSQLRPFPHSAFALLLKPLFHFGWCISWCTNFLSFGGSGEPSYDLSSFSALAHLYSVVKERKVKRFKQPYFFIHYFQPTPLLPLSPLCFLSLC